MLAWISFHLAFDVRSLRCASTFSLILLFANTRLTRLLFLFDYPFSLSLFIFRLAGLCRLVCNFQIIFMWSEAMIPWNLSWCMYGARCTSPSKYGSNWLFVENFLSSCLFDYGIAYIVCFHLGQFILFALLPSYLPGLNRTFHIYKRHIQSVATQQALTKSH